MRSEATGIRSQLRTSRRYTRPRPARRLPAGEHMTDIFISYGRADRPHAQRMASVLEGHGWSVWWDRKILAGDTFEQTVQRALNEARCVVVLWSAGSVTSSWVKDEATDGKRRNILVPVLIDEVDIPLGFRQLHAVSLFDAASEQDLSQFDNLVASVDNVLRRPAPAAEERRVTGEAIESSGPATPSSIEVTPLPRDPNARRSAGTVPRSYLYAALGLVVLFAIAAAWERFNIGERLGSLDVRPAGGQVEQARATRPRFRRRQRRRHRPSLLARRSRAIRQAKRSPLRQGSSCQALAKVFTTSSIRRAPSSSRLRSPTRRSTCSPATISSRSREFAGLFGFRRVAARLCRQGESRCLAPGASSTTFSMPRDKRSSVPA